MKGNAMHITVDADRLFIQIPDSFTVYSLQNQFMLHVIKIGIGDLGK